MIVLAYLGPLALIPFLVEKDDKEVLWHAKHGLVLLGAEILISIGLSILAKVACLGCLIAIPVYLGILVFHVMAIMKGINGERLTIPGLSDLADQF